MTRDRRSRRLRGVAAVVVLLLVTLIGYRLLVRGAGPAAWLGAALVAVALVAASYRRARVRR